MVILCLRLLVGLSLAELVFAVVATAAPGDPPIAALDVVGVGLVLILAAVLLIEHLHRAGIRVAIEDVWRFRRE